MNLASLSLYHQALLVAAALVLFTSFMMLATARIRPLIFAFFILVKILRGLKPYYEKHHSVRYTSEAIGAAVELA